MRTIMFIVKFLFLAAFFIVSNNNLALMDSDNRQVFFDSYVGWISEVGGQISTLSGYVVDAHWMPSDEGVVALQDNEKEVKKHTTVVGR